MRTVQESLKRDPHAGDLYIFRGRHGDLVKILWHDGLGMSLYAKRLDRGKFIWPSASDGAVSISAANHSLTITVASKPIPCAEYGRPLRRARRLGRKRRYCSDKCRSAARRTRTFVSGRYGSPHAAPHLQSLSPSQFGADPCPFRALSSNHLDRTQRYDLRHQFGGSVCHGQGNGLTCFPRKGLTWDESFAPANAVRNCPA
jgi:hypothetical protein